MKKNYLAIQCNDKSIRISRHEKRRAPFFLFLWNDSTTSLENWNLQEIWIIHSFLNIISVKIKDTLSTTTGIV